MTKPARIIRDSAIGLTVLIIALLFATVIVVQTDWFRNFVKQKIIAATEEGTGGKVEIGSFSFDVSRLQAVVTNFVIHGNEPPGSPPFVSAARVQADLRLFTSFKHIVDITYLGVDRLQANVIVLPDGRTNVPTPRQKSTSNKTSLETVVDLAVGHFELTNGLLTLASQKQALDVRGNNLRAQLSYDVPNQGYQGQVSLDPLYVVSGKNTPVNFTITVPVILQRDRIDVPNASIRTPASTILINGSLANLRNPEFAVHVNGHVALTDVRKAGNLPFVPDARNVPASMQIDANATVAGDHIQVTGLRLTLGQSSVEASGALKDPRGNGSLQFKTELALGELGRLANVSARPEGTIALNGWAKLYANNDYLVTGNLTGKNLSLQHGKQRLSKVNLASAVHFDRYALNLNGLRLSAFGAEFGGDASLTDFARYKLTGIVRDLDLQKAAQTFGQSRLPYDGVLSGPIHAEGDLKAPGTKSIIAQAHLAITPGRRGLPVSGRLNADYRGASDNIIVDNSYIALPHTRLDLNGSVGKQLNIALTSRDLNDLFAALPPGSKPPVALNGGQAKLTAIMTGGLTSPHMTGHLGINQFAVEGRQFNGLGADLEASRSGAAIRNGTLSRGPMQTQFAASVGLRNWSPAPDQSLTAESTIRNGDLADVMAMAGQPSEGYAAPLTADIHVTGTVGNPRGTASIEASKGTIAGESFDEAVARVNLTDQLVTIPTAYIASGPARVNMTAEFQHPRDSFTTGRVHVSLQSDQVNLAQIQNLQKWQPNAAGQIQIKADVTGNLAQTKAGGTEQSEFLLSVLNADASARGLQFQGQKYGDITATARTNGQTVTYNLASDFAGSNIRVNGNTQLARGYPTTADANINHLPVERMLVLAKRTDIPVRGSLTGTAHFTGTVEKPEGNVDLDLANAVLYDEPLDHVRARVSYRDNTVDVPQFEVLAGPSRVDLIARYDHPAGNFETGNLQLRVDSSRVDLARIRNLQKIRPGLGGTLQLVANGAGQVRASEPRILFSSLKANLAANGISAQGKNLGDVTLTADTASNGQLNFALDSNLAGSSVHGRGSVQLAGDYPMNAQLTFDKVGWNGLQTLLGPSTGEPPQFDAETDGRITVNGPAMLIDRLRGTFELTRLNVHTIPGPGEKTITIQNQGPIAANLERGVVNIVSARITGPQTDIQASGNLVLPKQTLNLTLNANANLGVLQNFSRQIYAAGDIILATTARGTFAKPTINGQLQLRNASLNYADLPNGISNANGVVIFNGNTASIRNLTAESGGGKITATGFVGFAGIPRLALRANAAGVRVRAQQGVSIVADADVRLTGTIKATTLSGTVTVDQVTYAVQSDIGSILSRAAPPVQAPSTPSPLLDNMKLDIRVRTSPALGVQASLAQNLQADADLRVQGTASQPGVLGRVTINEGQLVFFGSTYTVNSGTISFYNPVRIEPILNISLETQAKGVDVVLTVTGPIDNMKLSYTSDPPLQFQEIVSLLASGRTPTSDPTLLANQPAQPSQGFQQMGESALVSKALVDPVASQLQRVFGITQLKIDPTFTSGSQLPQAQLTLQQQISNNLTFTYVSALDDPNIMIIRIEWAFNPRWSAIASRDQNGIVSLNFLYKKQFR